MTVSTWTSSAPRGLASGALAALAAAAIACLLAAPPVNAEVSSVDAYGGQAAVLGKPQRKHTPPVASGGASETSGSGIGTHGSGSPVRPGGPPGPPSSAAGSGSHRTSGPLAGDARGGSANANGQGASSSSSSLAASQTAGGLSLSVLDVLVLAALLAVLIGSGAVVRGLSRSAP